MQREFERFLQDNPQWSDTTRSIYLGWSRTYETFLASRSLGWQAARRRDLEDFQQQLLWTPNGTGGLQSANTIYQGLRLLRAFYRWAVERQLVRVNPMDGWILPRPDSQPRTPLTWEQTQELFHAPDVGRPEGQRDLLLLHLVYQGLSLSQCIHLDIGSEVPAEDTLQAVRSRYLEHARPALMKGQEHTRLLVTNRGTPYVSSTGLVTRIKRYMPRLNAWILQDSRRAHEDEIRRRFGKISE